MRAEYQSPFSSSSRKLGDTERYRPSGVGCAREVTEKCKGAQRKTPTPPLDRRLARVRRALVDTRIVSTNLSLLKLPLSGRSVPRVQSRLVCGQPQRGAPNFTQHRIISRYALRFGPPNPFVRLKLLSDESLGDVNRSTKIPNKNKMVKKKKKVGNCTSVILYRTRFVFAKVVRSTQAPEQLGNRARPGRKGRPEQPHK